jgi:hypothetical protein
MKKKCRNDKIELKLKARAFRQYYATRDYKIILRLNKY